MDQSTCFRMSFFRSSSVLVALSDVYLPTLSSTFGIVYFFFSFFFSSRRRHTSWPRDWSSDVCSSDLGKLISKIILAVISFYFIFLASVTLKEMVIWTNISYLFKTPAFVLALFFIIPCVITALTSFRTIIVTNFILLIFVVVFGFFVAFTNMQFKDYALLRPF